MKIDKVLARHGFAQTHVDEDCEIWSRNGAFVSVAFDDEWYLDYPDSDGRSLRGFGGGELALVLATM